MKPASDGTALLEADEHITSSLVLPTIFKIIHQANPQTPIIVPALDGDIEMNGASYKAVNNEDLTDVVQEAREEYYADLVDRWESNLDLATKKFLFIAMQCDPRFKSMSSLPGLSDEDKAEARAWFKTEYAIHWKPQPSEPQPEPSEPQPEQPSAQPTLKKSCHNKKVNLSAFLGGREPVARLAAPTTSEIDLYSNLPDEPICTDPLEWWPKHAKSLPGISKMAQQYLGIPASSASVERLFSMAGHDFSKHRQAMSESTLENLMWARSYLKDNEP